MSIEIDLKPYGKEGVIVLEQPSFARTIAGQDAMISLCIKAEDIDAISKLQDDVERAKYTKACLLKSPAKLAVLHTMCYVESAPFLPDDDELHYDMFSRNMTDELYNNIRELVRANFKPINLMTD